MPDLSNESLSEALTQLRSADVRIQNRGVAAVIQIGVEAVPGLLAMLEETSGTPRAQVMYALSQIADPAVAPAFKRGLKDKDERVRSYAAVGLSRIGDPDALAALVQTIGDAADQLHGDMTPAVFALGEIGVTALPSLLDLLMDKSETTRLHTQRAIEQIMMRRHGFQPGQGFPDAETEEQFRVQWRTNGDYNYSAEEAPRAAAVEKLRRWAMTAED